uniref:Nucleotidyltransferase family protein n=1 Tax=candidate division WOR-3 bacterium TaxID=2052148 RepID=A0A7V0Z7I1_UNCW3
MKVEKDYEDLLKLFNKHKVKYCIVGAFAVAFYARPRYTKDIDILIEPSQENSNKIAKALNDFGFGSLDLKPGDFTKKNRIIQLGYEPVRIDIMTSLTGCSFDRIWRHKKVGRYGRTKVFFIGINELIENKKKSDRRQDKIDLNLLLKVKKVQRVSKI